MSTNETLLVTGAAGQLGRRVVEILLERGARSIVATTRDPEKIRDLAARGVTVRAADFEDPKSLVPAFRGATRALLVSTDALDRPGRRLAQHEAAVTAFREAGVGHVVYTSLPNAHGSRVSIAPDHAATEDAITRQGLAATFLRNNLYTDLMLHSLPQAVATGTLLDARGAGRTAFVTREDCAFAAAGALLDGVTANRTLDVTGPEALTSDEVAAIVSELVGRTIQHVSVTPAELVDALAGHGLPRPIAELFATFDAEIAASGLAKTTDAVARLSGRTPTRVADFLRANRAALG